MERQIVFCQNTYGLDPGPRAGQSSERVAASLDVFSYLDHRAFLRDYYDREKARGRGFSYRSFARRAGLKSPNYLKLVIDGRRNLSSTMAARFAEVCGLRGDAAAYFVELVAFDQAKTTAERNASYARLTSFPRYRSIHKLDLAQGAYHASWFIPAVRELATRPDFRAEPDWIAPRIRPPITRAEAERALATLFELGLLVRAGDGTVSQGEPLVSTGPETSRLHVANYHRTMIARAAASIDEVPAAQRDISSLTLAVGPEGLAQLKDKIRRFRRELLEASELEADPREVVQVNFQLFPLTRCEEVDR